MGFVRPCHWQGVLTQGLCLGGYVRQSARLMCYTQSPDLHNTISWSLNAGRPRPNASDSFALSLPRHLPRYQTAYRHLHKISIFMPITSAEELIVFTCVCLFVCLWTRLLKSCGPIFMKHGGWMRHLGLDESIRLCDGSGYKPVSRHSFPHGGINY